MWRGPAARSQASRVLSQQDDVDRAVAGADLSSSLRYSKNSVPERDHGPASRKLADQIPSSLSRTTLETPHPACKPEPPHRRHPPVPGE